MDKAWFEVVSLAHDMFSIGEGDGEVGRPPRGGWCLVWNGTEQFASCRLRAWPTNADSSLRLIRGKPTKNFRTVYKLIIRQCIIIQWMCQWMHGINSLKDWASPKHKSVCNFGVLLLCPSGITFFKFSYNNLFLFVPWGFVNCIVSKHVSPRILARALNNNSAPNRFASAVRLWLSWLTNICGRLFWKDFCKMRRNRAVCGFIHKMYLN